MCRRQIYTILLLTLSISAWAQSDFDLSQRWFNQALYNPAATGGNHDLGIFMHARQQWAGLDGAPVTGVLSSDVYIQPVRSGIGVSISADRIGFTNTYSGRLAYAYHISTTSKSFLSFGLSAGILGRNMNANGALIDNLNDPILYYGKLSKYSPDFDFGVEYQGIVKVGATLRRIGMKTDATSIAGNSMHLWAYISGHINTISYLTIEPVASYTHRDDINRYEVGIIWHLLKHRANSSYNNWAWVGGMYRLNKQYAIMAGIYLGKQFKVGYSFDYGAGSLSQISSYGTHELMVAWKFEQALKKDLPCASYGRSDKMNKFY